jgi:hypothetical protein
MSNGQGRMTHTLLILLPFLLFLASLAMLELGYRHRVHLIERGDTSISVSNPVSTTVLAMMGLVLAFTFSNAAGRLDASRATILQEVNAIETTWMRIDVAEPQAQPQLRELVRSYLDTRVRAYETFGDSEYEHQLQIGKKLLNDIWSLGVQATTVTVNRTLLLGAVNTMADSATTRTLSLGTHLPTVVLLFLVGIVLVGSMLIGSMLGAPGHPQWLERLIIAAVLSMIVYAIMDMEYPRLGTPLLQRADTMLVDLRKTMQ